MTKSYYEPGWDLRIKTIDFYSNSDKGLPFRGTHVKDFKFDCNPFVNVIWGLDGDCVDMVIAMIRAFVMWVDGELQPETISVPSSDFGLRAPSQAYAKVSIEFSFGPHQGSWTYEYNPGTGSEHYVRCDLMDAVKPAVRKRYQKNWQEWAEKGGGLPDLGLPTLDFNGSVLRTLAKEVEGEGITVFHRIEAQVKNKTVIDNKEKIIPSLSFQSPNRQLFISSFSSAILDGIPPEASVFKFEDGELVLPKIKLRPLTEKKPVKKMKKVRKVTGSNGSD